MPDNNVADSKENDQYQEDCNMPTAIEMMYYLSLCQGYSGEMED